MSQREHGSISMQINLDVLVILNRVRIIYFLLFNIVAGYVFTTARHFVASFRFGPVQSADSVALDHGSGTRFYSTSQKDFITGDQ